MASEVIVGVEGIDSPDSRLAVENALFAYSGVLDVDISQDSGELRVRFDNSNILAGDIEDTIRQEGFRVKYLRQ